VTPSLESLLFLAVQAVFWVFVFLAWVQVISNPPAVKGTRYWWACGSLLCASCALFWTTAMTIHSRVVPQQLNDRFEAWYLLCTFAFSTLGVFLGIAGKSRPRLVGLITSAFTMLIALGDAVSV
jgi:hypothetical protein